MPGVYFHWPFCRKKCPYCDFFTTFPFPDLVEAYYGAVLQELNNYSELDQEVTSVYFGGGTPSLLSASRLDRILQTLYSRFKLHPKAEITLEANPENLTRERLNDYFKLGINRLSLGAQSFADSELATLGRGHRAGRVEHIIKQARELGFQNISVDLIFALPRQTLAGWERNLAEVVSLPVEHVSAYCLSWPEKTVFAGKRKKGEFAPLSEDEELAMYRLTQEILAANGFNQYEISSFARSRFRSRHNSLYWENQPCLGLGAGAVSYDGKTRRRNAVPVRKYIKDILHKGSAVDFSETLSPEEKMGEAILLALRTSSGLDKQKYRREFNQCVEQRYRETIASLVKENLLIDTVEALYIPAEKMALADAVIREFL